MPPIDYKCTKEGDIATLKATHQSMADNIKEIKDKLGQIWDKLERQDDKFATKEKHNENETKINDLIKTVEGIRINNAVWLGGFTVLMFFIQIIVQKFF